MNCSYYILWFFLYSSDNNPVLAYVFTTFCLFHQVYFWKCKRLGLFFTPTYTASIVMAHLNSIALRVFHIHLSELWKEQKTLFLEEDEVNLLGVHGF